jgi:hypothetical protein
MSSREQFETDFVVMNFEQFQFVLMECSQTCSSRLQAQKSAARESEKMKMLFLHMYKITQGAY